MKRILFRMFLALFLVGIVVAGIVAIWVVSLNNSLPQIITLNDYKPLLVSNVYSRENKKIGEFFIERRIMVPYEKIPKIVVEAFLAAEDDQFFKHHGINFSAIARAMLANIRAGHSAQGGSTITQQVAKTLMLKSEKTLTRKVKDQLLALKMEKNLKKEEILYLYLNQIYLGSGCHGVAMAAETYFRKPLDKLTLAEAAILAGLPPAPSKYSPIISPKDAKHRQKYVLNRMADVGFIDAATAQQAFETPIKVYVKEKYQEIAPFYLETVRQLLVAKLGENAVLETGLQIYTGLDTAKQIAAQKSVEDGLRDLDKRQGYRGPLKNLATPSEVKQFLDDEKKKVIAEQSPARTIHPDGSATIVPEAPTVNSSAGLPNYFSIGQIIEGVVGDIDDEYGLVTVQLPDQTGIIDFQTMQWARKPHGEIRYDRDVIKKPSDALKKGDVISVQIKSDSFYSERIDKYIQFVNKKSTGKITDKIKEKTEAGGKAKYAVDALKSNWNVLLEQDPQVEGSLISYDLQTQDILAMVGGRDFLKSEFNRTIQAARQTGSSFKSMVYASALDKGYTPSTPILDAPVVFEEQNTGADSEGQGDASDTKLWKPTNHSKSFEGDILFRNALVKSLNVPTVRIIEDVGVNWVMDYARRLGIFSPLNKDFTLALGSSSVTLYEMTKVFANFGRMGQRIRPMLVHKVVDKDGKVILENLSLDARFGQEIEGIDQKFEERRKLYLAASADVMASQSGPLGTPDPNSPPVNPASVALLKKEPPLFFDNPEQLIKPTTAYLITSLLKATIEEPGGTGGAARALGREVAGKTGTTNGYYDGWFIGFTPQISTGVWVGFDKEHTLGVGEVGGHSALPIWLKYMKSAHEGAPDASFPVPSGIVFASIDNRTGKVPTSSSKNVVRQAFQEGSEPSANVNKVIEKKEEETDFYKQDLSD